MLHVSNRRLLTLVLGAGLCAVASTAHAQKDSPAQGEGTPRFDKPLNERSRATAEELRMRLGQPGVSGGSRTNVTVIEDGNRYELTIRDGEHSAKINGEAVPKDRIRVSDDKVELLGGDGSVVYRFETGKNLPEVLVTDPTEKIQLKIKELEDKLGQVAPGQRWLIEPQEGGRGFRFALPNNMMQAEPPPVMLGISMSEPTQDVLEHLGLPRDGAILVSAVQEDLPAAEAGLRVNDLIVGADGTRPINAAGLREILADKKDGDTIELVISRKGKEETLDVKLAAWDPEKMRWAGASEQAPGVSVRDEAMREIERALETLRVETEQSAQKVRETAIKALESAREALQESRLGMNEMLQEMMQGEGRARAFVFGDGPGDLFERLPEPPAVPAPPGAAQAPDARGRVRDLRMGGGSREAEAMDSLRAQLETMTRTMEKINERLDELEEKNSTQPR